MKNFLRFTLGAMMLAAGSFAASATTVALAGNFNNWSDSANKTSEIVDNCATIVVDNWQNGDYGFKFVIDGNWRGNGTENIASDSWVTINDDNSGNMKLDASANGRTVTFTYATDTKSFKAEWSTEGAVITTVAIAGGCNGWDASANKVEAVDGVATIVINSWPEGGDFKFVVNSSWRSNGNTAIENDVIETVGTENNDTNMKLVSSAEGRTVTFTYYTDTNSFKAVWDEEETPVEATYAYVLHGSFTSESWADVELAEVDGLWTASDVEVTYASAAFGMKKNNASTGLQAAWLAASDATELTETTTITLVENGSDITIATGTWDFSFNPETLALTATLVEGGEEPVVHTPKSDYYLRGSLNDWLNEPTVAELDKYNFYPNPGNASEVMLGVTIPANATFKIGDLKWTYNNIGGRTEGVIVEAGKEYTLWNNSASKDLTMGTGFTGYLYYNLTNGKLFLQYDAQAGIESVEAEAEAPVEYYTLQGVRVANPQGVVIERRGTSVRKVIL